MLMVSCSHNHLVTKEQYIRSFETFISETEMGYRDFHKDAWEKSNVRFKQLSETEFTRFEKDLTVDERLKIDRLIGRYYSFVAKYQAQKIQGKLKRVINQAESFIENIRK